MKRTFLSILILTAVCITSPAQRKIFNLPEIPGYVTLKCDFHLHSVFSDGSVWPLYRLEEAYLDGLDAIAITDHLEYTPKEDYIPVDHNAAWKISEEAAKQGNLILVHGAEITRDMPPGHFNALFIKDATELDKDSASDAVAAAISQGAFIQWNHPGWKSQEPDGIPKLYPLHKMLLEKGWLHGIEYFNSEEYYPVILDWCKKYNLAVMGNSDEHGIISESYREPEYSNRPMTLVFAKQRTSDSLKEALFAGRTLVWFKDMIGGKAEFARPFFDQSVTAGKVYHETTKSRYLEITNKSDVPFYLVKGPKGAPGSITLAARSVTRVVLSKTFTGQLIYDVKNIMTGAEEVLRIEIKYQG
jgi:histidinol phosphatase-like PHP family hydrolase